MKQQMDISCLTHAHPVLNTILTTTAVNSFSLTALYASSLHEKVRVSR